MRMKFEPTDFGPAFAPLLAIDRRRSLNSGNADTAARNELNRLSTESAFAHTTIADHDLASCCISGVWLLHDFLDESHTISQAIETPEGSYWHAIMHRREGDFSNAKYWFRRVGSHEVFQRIAEQTNEPYDPFAFVDRVQAALRGKPADCQACIDIQQLEWELLFDTCYRRAVSL